MAGHEACPDERGGLSYRSPMPVLPRFALVPLFACVSLASFGCSKGFPALDAFGDPENAPPAIRDAAQAVVKIRSPIGSATGSFVSSDGVLLTNNHVLGADVCPREGCYMELSFQQQRGTMAAPPVKVFAMPLHVNPGLDMAVVQVSAVDDTGAPGAPLSTPHFLTISPRDGGSLVGTKVFVVGHPEGYLKKWTTGDVVDNEGSWIEFSAPSLPGNSGSPLLDATGNIVGILHRGPTSIDLATSTGADVYSIGTPSEPLQAAMGADLPPTVLSLAGTQTADFVVQHQALYLNAHIPVVDVGGVPTNVIDLIGADCDKSMVSTGFTSLDDLYSQLSSCDAALSWIACEADATWSWWGVCPQGVEGDAWRQRFAAMSRLLVAFNGQVWTDAVSTGIEDLEPNVAQGVAAGGASLVEALTDAAIPIEWPILPSLALYGVTTYGGASTVSFVNNYRTSAQHYDLFVPELAYSAVFFAQQGLIPKADFLALLQNLAADPKLTLGGALLIEYMRYQWGDLN